MIIFIIFVSLCLGLSISHSYLIIGFLALVFLLFVYKRFNRYLSFLSLGVIVLSFGISCINISNNKDQYQGMVYEAKENYFLFNSGHERFYVYQKSHEYDIGDILTIAGKKEKNEFVVLESDFDFNEYLANRGVFYSLNVSSIKINYSSIFRLKKARNTFLNRFDLQERNIIASILFSENEQSLLRDELTSLHLTRFLAASSIYISLFAIFLNYILKLFLKEQSAEAITFGLVFVYSVFTFPRFAIVRVTFLLLFKYINKHLLKKRFTYLEILSSLGIFFLLLNRYLIFQDSFILGFSIPIISYFTANIYPENKIKRFVMRSLTIYLFFIPFEIVYYNNIVLFALPMQMIYTPIFTLLGICCLLNFFFIPLKGFISFLILIIKSGTNLFSLFSFSLRLPPFNSVIYLMFLFLFFVYLYHLSLGFRPFSRLLALTLISFVGLYALPLNNLCSSEICFINVGQGDCTLIRNHRKVALIDTGGLTYKDVAQDVLIPFLSKKRIYQIDHLFISHYDYDHSGALSSLKDHYRIKKVYDYDSSFPVQMGNITFFNYNANYIKSDDENDRSLVLGFSFLKYNFLLMGDATKYVEKQIISDYPSLKCDILKVGHHGSDTSSSELFISSINPKTAIISCGRNNSYGHPSASVIGILKKYKVEIRRTDIEGTITFKRLLL